MEITFDEQKFKELILYIATQCEDDNLWGATKLNKQLFFSDFLFYREFGKPITGADYMAIGHGPVPRRLLPIRASMVLNGDCYLANFAHQDRVVALRAPDLSLFTEQELSVVNQVIEKLRDNTADEVSELSHLFTGWIAAITEGQTATNGPYVSIPYGTSLINTVPKDEEVISDGYALAAKHDWPV